MALIFPPIYILPLHIPLDELTLLEQEIEGRGCLTYDIKEAKIVLGKVNNKGRAAYELRSRKLRTEEVGGEHLRRSGSWNDAPPKKKRNLAGDRGQQEIIAIDSTESETEGEVEDYVLVHGTKSAKRSSSPTPTALISSPIASESVSLTTLIDSQQEVDWGDTVKVLKLAWYTESVKTHIVLPFKKYLVYEGRPVSQPTTTMTDPRPTKLPAHILKRAKEDEPAYVKAPGPTFGRGRTRSPQAHRTVTRPTQLLHQTTSEHDNPQKFPPMPDYLKTQWSCQRPTPMYNPNAYFIAQLKKLMRARILTKDEWGELGYRHAIASIAAYPYTLSAAEELVRLPGCDNKIASLYQEWKESGRNQEVDEVESDPKLNVLGLFFEIWGVGATTANDFYNRGWRDLDDVVEYGWNSLLRVQQIGVKYYEEFQEKIPRAEVEAIGAVILEHANKVREGFQMVIVGGYRRGKAMSSDVDVILSHSDEDATIGFVKDVAESLEEDGWITHELTVSTANSERNQTPVSWKGDLNKKGTGFDTLDKALVVWQDLEWPTKALDLQNNPNQKNPNIHRRVDIIISPWKTAGCAVMGWSGGTTFQRDLRRYCNKVKNYKFDSSGVRSREDGAWIDLEKDPGDMLEKEKQVFAALGLEWRDPTDRCTG